jgi:hypothetical protein
MTKKNIQCSLEGLGRMMALRAQGRHGLDGVVGSRRRGLGEDDIVADSATVSQAWGRHLHGRRCHWLRSGKMASRKGLDRGQERQCGDSN